MSRTGKEPRATADRTALPLGLALLTAGLLPSWTLVRFGGESLGNGAPIVVSAALGYLIAMVVYRFQARLTYDGWFWLVLIGAIVSAALGLFLARHTRTWIVLVEVATLTLAPVTVGWTVRRVNRFRSAYVLGLLVLLGCVLARYWTEWPAMIRDLRYLTGDAMANGDYSVFETAGLPALPLGRAYANMMHEMVLYLPGLLTMSAVVQFSVGTLWFFYSTARRSVSTAVTLTFTRWKMPRPVVLVLLAAVFVHLSNDTGARVAADNVLFGLGIFYSVTGLSALEYLFQARRIPVWIRIVVYIVVAVTHLYGLAAMALVGVVDSLFGWRVSAPAKSKESVS